MKNFLLPILFISLFYWSCEEEEQEETPPILTVNNYDSLEENVFSEYVYISVEAEDESGIDRVEFYIPDLSNLENPDTLVHTDQEIPYEYNLNTAIWNTTSIEYDGEARSILRLRIVAYDKDSSSTELLVGIWVDNEDSRPQVVNIVSVDYTLDSMTVSWESSPDDDFGFYKLNQRIEIGGPTGNFNDLGTIVTIPDRSVTSYSIVDFNPNDYNWFSIEVEDTVGLKSGVGDSRHNDLDSDPSSVDIVDIFYDTTRMTITWEEYIPNESRLQRLNLQNGTSIVNDFHSYELYQSIEENPSLDIDYNIIATIHEQNDTTFSITEFDPTISNYFHVVVLDYWGNRSSYSDYVNEFPDPPTSPELFIGSAANDSLAVYWTQDSSGSFTYTLYQSETEYDIIDNAMNTWQTTDTLIMIPYPEFSGLLYYLVVVEDHWGLTGESDVEMGYYIECDTSEVALFGDCYSIENTTVINLEYSGIQGVIPEEIGLLINLEILMLNDNQLYGNIPISIGNLVNLERLQLQSNGLSGEIPSSIGNLQNLNFLWLSWNELSGTLPVEMANMNNLETLYIRDNNLSGVIPSNICDLNISFSDYERFRINDNDFCPPYPSCISLDILGYQDICECTDTEIIEIEGECYSKEYSTEINLSSKGISEIPSDIYDFTNLRILRLNNNSLSGTIPSQIFNITTLRELYLNDNDFSNEIPSSVGNLTQLTRFELHHNNLSGSIPTSICNIPYLCISCYPEMNFDHNKLCPPYPYCAVDNPSLNQGHQNICDCDIEIVEIEGECYSPYYTTSIDLSYKGLSEIPEELYAFTNLTSLNLNNNNFSGEIPDGLLSFTNLDVLYLANNNFSGELPTELFNSEIKILNLSNNNFSGTIPSEIGIMDSIVDLNLSYNNISGTIPVEVGNLTHVNYLQLQGNQLSGNFPESICEVNLNVSNNRLCPPYPECVPGEQITSQNVCDCDLDYEIVQLVFNDDTLCVPQDIEDLYPDDLTSIDAGGSTIPSEIGSLVNLRVLNLAGIGLTGPIPSEIGSLVNLFELDLRDNMLTGPIPPEIGNLTDLRNLFFENNELSGSIPSEIGNLINIESYLNLHDNMLSGPIPASIGNLTGIRHLYFFNNELSGEIPSELSNLVICNDFKLSNNHLSGEIPESLCLITNEAHNWDYFNNNNLCPPYPTCFLPEEFEDNNDNGYWDDGEPYTDANGNEHYDGNRVGSQDTTNCD